jgi:beta-glucosidase
MSLVNAEGQRAVMPGRVTVYAGGGQPDYGPSVQDSFTITTEQPLPR